MIKSDDILLSFCTRLLHMKIFVFLFLVSLNSFSQKNVKEFYDADWILEDSANAKYYRIISYDKNKKPIGKIRDYYMSGKLQFKGEITSIDPEIMKGKCTWYYENGKKMYYVNYNNEGVQEGKMKYYYENGKKWSVGNWFPYSGKQDRWKFYYNNGMLEHTGCYEKNHRKGVHKHWYSNGAIKSISYDSPYSSTIYWTEKGEKKILLQDDGGLLSLLDSVDQLMDISKHTTILKETITIIDNDPSSPNFFDTHTYADYGLKEGENKIYDGIGNLKYKFNLKEGLMEGTFIKYYTNGIIELELAFHKNICEGKLIYYLENGKPYRMENYHNGELHGISRKWGGAIQIEERNYRNGKLQGLSKGVNFWDITPTNYFIEYYKRDKLLRSELFYVDTITLTPKLPMFNFNSWPNNQKAMKKFSGNVISYHENGQIFMEQFYKKGKPVGMCTIYYSNGKKKEVGEPKVDQILSPYPAITKLDSYWDTIGNQLVKNGNGTYIAEYGGGEMTYKNGYLVKRISYQANGKISTISNFENSENGIIISEHEIVFDEEGRKSQEYIVKDSVGTITAWFKNGNIKLIRTNPANNPNMSNGLWVDYYENGNKSQEGNYLRGAKDGLWKYYNENGTLIREELYRDNKLRETKSF